jgi:hypothetical protein
MIKINGLLTQKPTSPVPRVGEIKRYSLEQRVGKSGKPWTKVKAEGEGYGKPYEVVSVEKTDFVDSHGNVSFNVDLIELSGNGAQGEPATDVVTASHATPAQAIRSTSTNGTSSLDALGVSSYAALGKADEVISQFFSVEQRAGWSAYEAADLVLRLAIHWGISLEKR